MNKNVKDFEFMNVSHGDIIRYILVSFGFGYPSWYYDELDEAEKGDLVLASYGVEELTGQVVQGVRCVYPHVIFDVKKTKPIFEIVRKNNNI